MDTSNRGIKTFGEMESSLCIYALPDKGCILELLIKVDQIFHMKADKVFPIKADEIFSNKLIKYFLLKLIKSFR